MAKRIRIGILFMFGRYWMGGVYYLVNLIHSLDFLDDRLKPHVTVYYDDEGADYINLIKYPYLDTKYLEDFKFRSYKRFLASYLNNYNYDFRDLLEKEDIAGIFPVYNFSGRIRGRENKTLIAWFPDLQHKYYPQFFSKFSRFARDIRIKLILRNADKLVLSSNDVYSHFKEHFSMPESLSVNILPFVSLTDNHVLPSKEVLLQKYNLPETYFMVCNQFYEHKNHKVIFQAANLMLEQGRDFAIVCTGELKVNVKSEYVSTLFDLLDTLKVKDAVKILGFVDRADQLGLMKYSNAVIQPSKFEGWSTVIEDAKSIGAQIIASNIPVHHEQLNDNGFYFDPDDEKALADLLEGFVAREIEPKRVYRDLHERTVTFAKGFISLFSD